MVLLYAVKILAIFGLGGLIFYLVRPEEVWSVLACLIGWGLLYLASEIVFNLIGSDGEEEEGLEYRIIPRHSRHRPARGAYQ